jgi:hypothetical protein
VRGFQLVIVAVGGVALIATVIATYYAISYAVLVLVGKIFSLTGHRRR